MKIIIKEKLIAARVPEDLAKDFKKECIDRDLSNKQALAQAIYAWMISEPDQARMPVSKS